MALRSSGRPRAPPRRRASERWATRCTRRWQVPAGPGGCGRGAPPAPGMLRASGGCCAALLCHNPGRNRACQQSREKPSVSQSPEEPGVPAIPGGAGRFRNFVHPLVVGDAERGWSGADPAAGAALPALASSPCRGSSGSFPLLFMVFFF